MTPEQHRQLYHQRLSNGLCTRCGKNKISNGKSNCDACRNKHSNKRYILRKNRQVYEKCQDCGNAREEGKERCRPCLDKRNNVAIARKLKAIINYGRVCYCCKTNENMLVEHKGPNSYQFKKLCGLAFYFKLEELNYPKGFRSVCQTCRNDSDKSGKCLIHQ